MSDDSQEDSVGPGIKKTIGIVIPIALIGIIVSGLFSGKYSLGFPTSGDFNWMLIMFVLLNSVGVIGNIFKTVKDKDQFHSIYSSSFILIILASLFVKGLSLFEFLVPFMLVTFGVNWLTGRTKRAKDLATDDGEKELDFGEFKAMFKAKPQHVNAFKDGIKEIRNSFDKLEKQKDLLAKALNVSINIPRQRVQQALPVGSAGMGNTIFWQSPKATTTPAEYDPSKYSNYYESLSGPVTTAPLAIIDNMIERVGDLRKKKGAVSHYGSKTKDKYMAIAQDASNLYKESVKFAWEIHKIQFIGKALEMKDGQDTKNYIIYKRFEGHQKVLNRIIEVLETITDILDGIEKQAPLLGLDSNQVRKIEVAKPNLIEEGNTQSFLSNGNFDKESYGGTTTFEQEKTRVQELISVYMKNIKRTGVHSAKPKTNPANWPSKLKEGGVCKNQVRVPFK